jgi:amidophosphoribosyltransferase
MSKLGDFIAFRAAIALLQETNQTHILTDILTECQELERNHQLHTQNLVRKVYKPFSLEQISNKIAQLITPSELSIEVEVIYQTIETLHKACPTNTGDWYFTGNYPTPGGNRVCNKAFMNYMSGKNVRGY